MMIGYQEMTATQTATQTATRTQTTTSAVSWRCVQAGLWVASGEQGEPLGIVSENWGRGFALTTAWGLDLGLHPTLPAAKTALEQAR